MINKTPLRLVAIEETPQPDENDEEGAPVISISDEQAITRKVPESAMIAAHETLADKANQFRRWHKLVPGAAVALLLVVIAVALATKRKAPVTSAAAPAAPRMVEVPSPPAPAPREVASAAPAVVPPPAARAETIHVRITAAPAPAELSLDGNVVAGRRLDLDVPVDRNVHVVSASAPGYLTFNQQVGFTRDVALDINLRRGRAATVHAPTRARPPAPEATPKAAPKADVKATAAHPTARPEPGMNLEGPLLRPAAKPIDERNPYKP
jgi:hypothetical protein